MGQPAPGNRPARNLLCASTVSSPAFPGEAAIANPALVVATVAVQIDVSFGGRETGERRCSLAEPDRLNAPLRDPTSSKLDCLAGSPTPALVPEKLLRGDVRNRIGSSVPDFRAPARADSRWRDTGDVPDPHRV